MTCIEGGDEELSGDLWKYEISDCITDENLVVMFLAAIAGDESGEDDGDISLLCR